MSCDYDTRCRASNAIGFRYCPDHLRTPRGLQHAREVIDAGELFTESDIAAEVDKRTRGSDKSYQMTALEKMDAILDEKLNWLAAAKQRLYAIDPDDWRYTDRTGSEQVRTELAVYERASAEAARLVERVSKMALQEKITSLGRAQMELVIEMVQGTLEDVIADPETVQAAKKALYKRFQERANLTTRLEDEAKDRLQIED